MFIKIQLSVYFIVVDWLYLVAEYGNVKSKQTGF